MKNGKNSLDENIEKELKRLNENKTIFNNLKKAKYELDKKLSDIRDKINSSERIKNRYMNLICMYFPVKLDQFCKLEAQGQNIKPYNKLSSDISKAILITNTKLNNLNKFNE